MQRRTMLRAALAASAGLAGASVQGPAVARGAAGVRVGATLARGLSFPWGIDFLPDGSALVTERNSGRVLRVAAHGGFTVVGRVSGVFNGGGEGGLLGLALSPQLATDHWVYVYLTTRHDNRVLRMQYDGSVLGRPSEVLTGIPRSHTHNGGGLWFGGVSRPSLFVTTGDTRRPELAQDRRSLAGKILRLKPDGTAQVGNPFASRVYTYGHRNPEGITVGPDGAVWSSELGENTWDELNRIRPGRNYGWPRSEGGDGRGGYTDPFARWHTDVCSPSGVALAGGRAWVAALRGECLWSVHLTGAAAHRRTRYLHRSLGRVRMVRRAPDGSLWVGTSNGGGADRIVRVTVS
jgi:glucose/arabinose dehydrogenase